MSNKGLTRRTLDSLGLHPFTTDCEGMRVIDSLDREKVPVLFSEDGRKELRRLWSSEETWKVQLFGVAFEGSSWRYNRVNSGVKGIAEAVYMPKCELTADGKPTWPSGPPTTGEIVLVRAWNACGSFIDDSTAGNSGMVVVVAQENTDGATIELAGALVGGESVAVREVGYPAALTVTEWTAQDREAVHLRKVVRDLLGIALAQNKVTQRFMAFYRVFEHMYLGELYEQLQNEFYGAPRDVLESVSKKLEKELHQLQNLVEKRSVESYFELIADSCDARKKTNKFAIALLRANVAGDTKTETREKWKRGVHIVYKIRCAIVHAGEGSPVYEQYADAAELVEEALVDLEDACFRIVGLAY